MRSIKLLLAIAFTIPIAHAEVRDAIWAEAQVFPVTYDTLISGPEQFLYSKVEFRCTFATTSALYDPLTIYFRPELYRNFTVWDSSAKLWDSDVRGKPLLSLYCPVDRKCINKLNELKKYQVVDIIGRVSQIINGVPFIHVTEIETVDDAGTFSDNSIYHIEQGQALTDEGLPDLADAHFAAAQAENLPIFAAVDVRTLRARELASAGHNHEAIVLLREALFIAAKDPSLPAPDLAEVYALYAKVENDASNGAAVSQRQELLNSSVEHARKALFLDPSLADAYAVLGISLAGLGQFDEARRECDNALRLRPNDAEVRWYLGRILDQQGNFDESIDALKKAIDLTPKDARIHKAVASAYYHRGLQGGPTSAEDLKTALREDDIALRLTPGDPESLYSSGLVLIAAADAGAEVVTAAGRQPATIDMAIERFRAALAADETFALAHGALGDALKDTKPDEAMTQYERLVELQPDDFNSIAVLASFKEAQGQTPNALSLYNEYLARQPMNPQVRVALVRLYTAEGNQLAIQGMQKQLVDQAAKDDKNPLALIDLAEFDLAIGDAKSALDLANRAAEMHSHAYHLQALATLAKAQWELGDVKGTVATLAPVADQIVDEAALTDLGWAYTVMNQSGNARSVADKLRTSGVATGASAEFIGWAYYQSGDFVLAERQLKKATFASPQAMDYRLGMALFRQGPARYKEARLLLGKAVGVTGNPLLYANASNEIKGALATMGTADDQSVVPAAPSDSTTAAVPATPTDTATAPDANAADPVAIGLAKWAADDVKGTIDALAPVTDKLDSEPALLALGWAYVADNRLNDAAAIATKLKDLPAHSDAQDEFQGWVLYLNGDYRGAEDLLKRAPIDDRLVKAYRIGMALYMQGPPRYSQARAMLNIGQEVTGRKSLLGNAKADAEQALQTINGAK